MIPTKKQWQKWSLPSKYSFVGVILGAIGIFITLTTIGFNFIKRDEAHVHYEVLRASRGEFLALSISKLLESHYIPEPAEKAFHDVQATYTYAKEISYAKDLGIISKNYRFNPEEEIVRKEAAVILSNTICVAIGNKSRQCAMNSREGKDHLFVDLNNFTEFKPYINHLVHIGLIELKERYFPNRAISKDEALILIKKANEWVEVEKNKSNSVKN